MSAVFQWGEWLTIRTESNDTVVHIVKVNVIVTIVADIHQVAVSQSNARVIYVFRCQFYFMVNNEAEITSAYLAETAVSCDSFRYERLSALVPRCGMIKLFCKFSCHINPRPHPSPAYPVPTPSVIYKEWQLITHSCRRAKGVIREKSRRDSASPRSLPNLYAIILP